MTEAILSFSVLTMTLTLWVLVSMVKAQSKRIHELSEAFVTTSKRVEELMRTLAEIEKGTLRYRVETGSLSVTHRTN